MEPRVAIREKFRNNSAFQAQVKLERQTLVRKGRHNFLCQYNRHEIELMHAVSNGEKPYQTASNELVDDERLPSKNNLVNNNKWRASGTETTKKMCLYSKPKNRWSELKPEEDLFDWFMETAEQFYAEHSDEEISSMVPKKMIAAVTGELNEQQGETGDPFLYRAATFQWLDPSRSVVETNGDASPRFTVLKWMSLMQAALLVIAAISQDLWWAGNSMVMSGKEGDVTFQFNRGEHSYSHSVEYCESLTWGEVMLASMESDKRQKSGVFTGLSFKDWTALGSKQKVFRVVIPGMGEWIQPELKDKKVTDIVKQAGPNRPIQVTVELKEVGADAAQSMNDAAMAAAAGF
jgi:hypothetical protein